MCKYQQRKKYIYFTLNNNNNNTHERHYNVVLLLLSSIWKRRTRSYLVQDRLQIGRGIRGARPRKRAQHYTLGGVGIVRAELQINSARKQNAYRPVLHVGDRHRFSVNFHKNVLWSSIRIELCVENVVCVFYHSQIPLI